MKIDFNLHLENVHVILRPMQLSDVDAFFALSSDEQMWTYFTSNLSVKSELEQWVADGMEETKSGRRLAFTIIDKASGMIAGATSLGNISYRDRRIEIGWTWLGRVFWGKGINDAAKLLMLEYCFEELQFERVELKTDVLNLPARSAMLRISFKEEGVLRSHTLMVHNRRRDTVYFSMLAHEWDDLKER